MRKILALLLIVPTACLFPHVCLFLGVVACLGWIAFDAFLEGEIKRELGRRSREERERQLPAADRFQAWLDSNQRSGRL